MSKASTRSNEQKAINDIYDEYEEEEEENNHDIVTIDLISNSIKVPYSQLCKENCL